ncbi:hypothetical protein B0H11DRAFT_1724914 [Mycena galericulata]|nr:hypothetical protein B0H11DRAFT_1724914 [Mycena galericulata]
MSSSTEISPEDDKSFWNIRELRFRVLILGRANAGKTTILERLTGAAMDTAKVRRNRKVLRDQRGVHNIEDEIHFSSKPGFVFHDSCGVEAGSTEELSVVKQFVERCSSVNNSREQLHAIWYSFPLLISDTFLSQIHSPGCVFHSMSLVSYSRGTRHFSIGRRELVSSDKIIKEYI